MRRVIIISVTLTSAEPYGLCLHSYTDRLHIMELL